MQIISKNNYGDLTIEHDGHRYTYYTVPVFQVEKATTLIQKKAFGKVFRLLSNFSLKNLYKKGGDTAWSRNPT